MKNIESVNLIVMIIGAISVVSGIYFALSGGEFANYVFGIFIGLTLVGTAYYNNKEWKKKNNQEHTKQRE